MYNNLSPIFLITQKPFIVIDQLHLMRALSLMFFKPHHPFNPLFWFSYRIELIINYWNFMKLYKRLVKKMIKKMLYKLLTSLNRVDKNWCFNMRPLRFFFVVCEDWRIKEWWRHWIYIIKEIILKILLFAIFNANIWCFRSVFFLVGVLKCLTKIRAGSVIFWRVFAIAIWDITKIGSHKILHFTILINCSF